MHTDSNWTSGCPGLGRLGTGVTASVYGASPWGDGNILELDSGDGWLHNVVNILKPH